MCRVLRVVILGPADLHLDVRRKISSIAYEVIAAVTSADDVPASTDVVLAWEPEASTVDGLHGRGLKVAAVNAPDVAADLHLAPDELRSFAERVSDLFRVT